MKEKTKDRYELFLIEFENNIRHLIVDANYKFSHRFSEEDERIKLKVFVSSLSSETINIIEKYFKSKYILSTGILKERDLICINIY